MAPCPAHFTRCRRCRTRKRPSRTCPARLLASRRKNRFSANSQSIASALECTWGYVPAAARPAYHAAAVLVSNYTIALAHAGIELWQALGKSEQEGLEALVPLLQGAVNNLRRLGPEDALTGPMARGDWATVQRNLTAIRETAPQQAFPYAAMALAMIYNNLAAIDGNDGALGKNCAVDKTALERELQTLLSATLKNRGTS